MPTPYKGRGEMCPEKGIVCNNQELTVAADLASPVPEPPDSNAVLIHAGYGHSEADVLHQSLLEANIATEVCLTTLDTLSLFTLAFKVGIKHVLPKVRGFIW